MSGSPQPFPHDVLNEIRLFPGNEKCCDCPSLDTDWASVSHGTLICLDCAGKHRSLGVQVSFVRSITMDTWSKQQIEMVRQGGNGQIRRFFKKLEIDSGSVQQLYCSKAAEHYREKLKERAEKVISGEISGERRMSSQSSKHSSQRTNDRQMHENSPIPCAKTHEFTAVFGEGALGLTLTKDSHDRAVVSRLVPEGAAQREGVKVGDYIVGVQGVSVVKYDEIMRRVASIPRPLSVTFARTPLHASRSEPALDSLLISEADSSIPVHWRANHRISPAKNHTSPSKFPQSHTSRSPLVPSSSSISPYCKNRGISPCFSEADSSPAEGVGEDKSFLQYNESLHGDKSPSVRFEIDITSDSPVDSANHLEEEDSDMQNDTSALSVSFEMDDNSDLGLNDVESPVGESCEASQSMCGTQYSEYVLTFRHAPLGLTLSANKNREPEVIRIKFDGNAHRAGVAVGDILLQIDKFFVREYQEAMRFLPECVYPLTLKFRRGKQRSPFSPSLSSSHPNSNRVHWAVDNDSFSCSADSWSTKSLPPRPVSTFVLSPQPSHGEFDVIFEEGDLGFRIEESSDARPRSIVTEVTKNSTAFDKGVRIGDAIVGINCNPYLSHAHATATLKHAKRPISVRFKR